MKIKSVDKHLRELLKDPVFKKEYLKDKKRLKGVIKNMKDRERIKKYLRKQMEKVPEDAPTGKSKQARAVFAFCYAQARFDILMEIDMELKLGAFYKK